MLDAGCALETSLIDPVLGRKTQVLCQKSPKTKLKFEAFALESSPASDFATNTKAPSKTDEAFAFVLTFGLATNGSSWPHRRCSIVIFQAEVSDEIRAHDVPQRVL